MQVDHGRLNIGVAQHGLDLPDGGPMVQGQRGRRMAQRMGRDRADRLRLGVEEPREARLLQMVPHHGLNRPNPQRPAAATLRDIVRLRVVFPRPAQPAEERMLGEWAAKGRRGIRDLMMPGVMDPSIECEGLEHPGGQHHRLLGRVAALAMEIEDRMAVALREMPPLRPRQFNTPRAGTDPEECHGVIAPFPLLRSWVRHGDIEGVHEPGDFCFGQTISHKPFRQLQALHLPHRMVRNLAGPFEPGTKGAQAREVGIDRPRGQLGAGPLPFGGGEKGPVALEELGGKTLRLAGLLAGLAPPAKKVGETAAIEELGTRGGIAGTEGRDHRGEKMLEGGTLDRDPRRPGQEGEGVKMDPAFGRGQPGF